MAGNERGIYERIPGSDEWWIRHADVSGCIRRESAGTKGAAINHYRKRKTEILERKKPPETLRARAVRFSELAADARKYAKDRNWGQHVGCHRIPHLKKAFGDRTAEIPIEESGDWFSSHECKPGIPNFYRVVLWLIRRLGIENKKASSNPARLLKRQKGGDGRVRFLNRHAHDEELRLRKVTALKYPNKMSEFDIALNRGTRRNERCARIEWSCVDISCNDLFIRGSKTGKSRRIHLNSAAIAAFKELRRGTGGKDRIFAGRKRRSGQSSGTRINSVENVLVI